MLTLTRPHRQALATLALILGTVAPTIYVASIACKINRPGHLRDVEVELGRQLGLQVTLKSVAHPRPGEDVLRGVVLRQEEPRGKSFFEVARADEVRVHRKAGELVVEAAGLRLRGEGPRQAMDQATALLRRAGDVTWKRVGLSAPTCEIELGDEGLGYTLREVIADFRLETGSPAVHASYRMLGDGPTTRCELTLRRDRAARPVRTTLAFETKEGLPLPARVLDPFFAAADWLGPEARVSGALTLTRSGEAEWEAEFRGDLLGVDLATLVAARFPDHHLAGTAAVQVRSARWANRGDGKGAGWVEAEGALAVGPGTIGAGLLRAIGKEMQFRLDPRLAAAGDADIAFQDLGLGFAMAGDGQLRLTGDLGTDYPAGAVIGAGAGRTPLAAAPAGATSVRGLWNALYPQAAGRAVIVDDPESLRLRNYLPPAPALDARTAQKAN